MNFMYWLLSTLGASVLVGAAIWLCKNLILTRLKKAVETEFDEKLERVRSEHRISEENFKTELRMKEGEIQILRATVMNTLTARHTALEQKRLEAAEQLWSSVLSLAPAKMASKLLASFKLEVVAAEIETNPKLQELFKIVGPICDLKKMPPITAHKARPFVPPMVWAVYSAYAAVASSAVIRVESFKVGLAKDLADHPSIVKLIKAVLPHQTAFVDTHGVAGYASLLDELEEMLLKEIQTMLSGEQADIASVARAAQILNEVENFSLSANSQKA
jgi:hypothetical protein